MKCDSLQVAARWLAVSVLVVNHVVVPAATPTNITAGEIALLPDYCPLTQTFTKDAHHDAANRSPTRLLFERLGPSFIGLHHYCWGLIHVMRAKQAGVSAYDKRAMYGFAIDEYKFAIRYSTPDFALLPELYLRVGEANVELQDYGQAFDAFSKSRALKLDYWPPYLRWASVLLHLGKQAEALAHLEEGLRIMPNERALIDAYTRMGGTRAQLAKALQAAPAASAASAALN
jgi:tetratricopeptide (TPR) repeat protein